MTNLQEEEKNLVGEENLSTIKKIFNLKSNETLDKIDKELIKKVEENIDILNELNDVILGDKKHWIKTIKKWRKHLKDFKKDKVVKKEKNIKEWIIQ